MRTDDLRARMTEAAKDAFADEAHNGVRLFTDQREPWRALDDALAAAWAVVAPELERLRQKAGDA